MPNTAYEANAERGDEVLRRYPLASDYSHAEDRNDWIGDLIADVLTTADQEGLDARSIVTTALYHLDAEKAEHDEYVRNGESGVL